MSWDGRTISSSRIRMGEIDREGDRWIPELFESNEMTLTPQVESELKDPFGQLSHFFLHLVNHKLRPRRAVGD